MKISGLLPVRFLIILPFSCLLLIAALVFSYVSYQNNRAVALKTAQAFNDLVSQHIENYVINMTDIMPKLIQNNAKALVSGILSSDDPIANSPFLLSQLRLSEQLNYVTLAFNDGRYVAASRPPLDPSKLQIATNLLSDEHHLQGFFINEQDLPADISIDLGIYDPRQRPFMQCALAMPKEPCWGEIYRYVDGSNYAVSLSYAVTNGDGNVIAVTAADISLERLSVYMGKLNLNNSSVALLFEKDGSLLASSSPDYAITATKTSKRTTLINHPDPIIRALAAYQEDEPSVRVVKLNNQDFVLTLKHIPLGYGKVWLLAVLQPLDVAMSVMTGDLSNTIILIVVTLLAMIFVGAALAKLIAKPIENIASMASEGALIELEKAPFKDSALPEVRGLSESLSRLAKAQRESIAHLEKRVAQRTSELEKANARLLSISQKDPLTGIANRRAFDESYSKQWLLAQRQQTPLAVIFCDVDHFKAFNDKYGHQEGDAALKRVAKSMRKQIQRPTDLLARYGGEEFVIVLPQTDEQGAWELAEKIREAVAAENITRDDVNAHQCVTLSLGFASMTPRSNESQEALIRLADKQLYNAKANGRNQTQPQRLDFSRYD